MRAQRKLGRRSATGRLAMLTIAAIAFVFSLATVVRVNALPVEAHQTETWFAYKQQIAHDFTAAVQSGAIYKNSRVSSQDLVQIRLPVDPPAYRRVLVSKLTDSLTIRLPYKFTADRPGDIKVTYWVDGTFGVPNLWQRPYPLLEKKEITVTGNEVSLPDLTVTIPVKQLMAELERLTQEMKFNQETGEVRIRPIFQVEVQGQREPISAALTTELVINLRGPGMAIDVDDAKVFADEKSFSVNKILPATVTMFGHVFEVNLLRQLGTTAASIFAGIMVLVVGVHWMKKKVTVGEDLKRLGTSLILARNLELPPDAAVVDVRSVQQLIALHVQTDRPVIRHGSTCYLIDGTTCYRLALGEAAAGKQSE